MWFEPKTLPKYRDSCEPRYLSNLAIVKRIEKTNLLTVAKLLYKRCSKKTNIRFHFLPTQHNNFFINKLPYRYTTNGLSLLTPDLRWPFLMPFQISHIAITMIILLYASEENLLCYAISVPHFAVENITSASVVAPLVRII